MPDKIYQLTEQLSICQQNPPLTIPVAFALILVGAVASLVCQYIWFQAVDGEDSNDSEDFTELDLQQKLEFERARQ